MKISSNRLRQIIKEEVNAFVAQEAISTVGDAKALQADIDNLSSLVRTKANALSSEARSQLQIHVQAALAVLGAQH